MRQCSLALQSLSRARQPGWGRDSAVIAQLRVATRWCGGAVGGKAHHTARDSSGGGQLGRAGGWRAGAPRTWVRMHTRTRPQYTRTHRSPNPSPSHPGYTHTQTHNACGHKRTPNSISTTDQKVRQTQIEIRTEMHIRTHAALTLKCSHRSESDQAPAALPQACPPASPRAATRHRRARAVRHTGTRHTHKRTSLQAHVVLFDGLTESSAVCASLTHACGGQ